jgi:hypothetical protein
MLDFAIALEKLLSSKGIVLKGVEYNPVDKIWNNYKVTYTLDTEFSFEEFIHFCEDIYVRYGILFL